MKCENDFLWSGLAAFLALGHLFPNLALGQAIPTRLLAEDFQIMRQALEQAHGGLYRYTSKADMDSTFDRAYKRIDQSHDRP